MCARPAKRTESPLHGLKRSAEASALLPPSSAAHTTERRARVSRVLKLIVSRPVFTCFLSKTFCSFFNENRNRSWYPVQCEVRLTLYYSAPQMPRGMLHDRMSSRCPARSRSPVRARRLINRRASISVPETN